MEGRTSQKEDLKPTGSLVTTRVPGLVVAECNRIDRSIERTVLRKLDFKYIHGVYCKSGGAVADADARLLPVLSLAYFYVRNARNKAPLRPRLLVILAHSKTAPDTRQEDMRVCLKRCPERLVNVAYTFGVRRDHLSHRAYTIIDGVTMTGFRQVSNAPSRSPTSVVFTFTGQGAHIQRDIRAMDKVLQELCTPPRWSIEEELRNLQGNNHINCPEYTQTLCAAVQIALVNFLKGWGVSVSGAIRHSSGEVIAAYGTGAALIYTAIITAHLCGR
ncbi:hypothetical protein BDV23DRAFT_178510 [Aspergillus alliaceus]|uniref:Uncharacterized protein n=1 Tax=Petromyces alliaceus TaxID=209559 RepID=A0A5N7CNZ1_PETAA|nr:hypothetical protein BDV23DRAFT_178510 [Aspergillus alliaceus]